MSLKKGDLVEVIGCFNIKFSKFVGERFILNERTLTLAGYSYASSWRSPFNVENSHFCPQEKYLRKVTSDGDELSDESFDSLMAKLKSAKKDNNIVTVNIKVEENMK